MNIYKPLYNGGDECTKKRAYIRLYPNTSYEDTYYVRKGDDIPSAIDGAFSTLLSADAVSYYDVQRAQSSAISYPDISFSGTDDLRSKFRSYLETGSENGTGQNLKDMNGIHMLVHSEGC
ncbi:hypothetical protein [Halobaculum sp. MBLA0143]|uniref:hypothetical protein n=1 Tax=Halobaculum sp. MBLA0143 TaxID=3079933 RepID=UPI00352587F7